MHSGFVLCSLDYRIVSILRREQHRRMRSEIILIIRFKARARPEYAVNGGQTDCELENWDSSCSTGTHFTLHCTVMEKRLQAI